MSLTIPSALFCKACDDPRVEDKFEECTCGGLEDMGWDVDEYSLGVEEYPPELVYSSESRGYEEVNVFDWEEDYEHNS